MWAEILFRNEKPERYENTFCIIGGEKAILQYQGDGYPLYDPLANDTCDYTEKDIWLKEI